MEKASEWELGLVYKIKRNRFNLKNYLRVKGRKKIFQSNGVKNQAKKIAGAAIPISNT